MMSDISRASRDLMKSMVAKVANDKTDLTSKVAELKSRVELYATVRACLPASCWK